MGLGTRHVKRIVFRADGNSTIGLGHVFRLLSLIELFKDQFKCLFVIQQPEEKIRSQIEKYCEVRTISKNNEEEQLNSILQTTDILVLDGYQFTSAYQQLLKKLVHKLVAIDDKAAIHFYADLVINHGGEFVKHNYRVESYTKVLTGFKYVMVRKEFLEAALQPRTASKVNTAYICMGGADPFNVTVKALKACNASGFLKKIIVVTGSAYQNKVELLTLMDSIRHQVHIQHEENIDARRMVELIRECEIAICPASSVAIEVCCVKCGLLSGTVIDNQAGIHKQLKQSGSCVSVEDFNLASVEDVTTYLHHLSNVATVNNIMQKQGEAIDGLSVARIINEFNQLALC